jgi:hypothetical protein
MTFTGEASPVQQLMLSLLGAVAERALIRERQREGIELANKHHEGTRIAVAALALPELSAFASGDGAAPAATGASVPDLARLLDRLHGTRTQAVTEPSVGT